MRLILLLILVVWLVPGVLAQEVLHLWQDGKMPFAKSHDIKEYEADCGGWRCLYDISQPTLTVYQPAEKSSSKAVIVIPGGGYSVEAIFHEGYEVAKALADRGITAGVLKYRLPDPRTSDSPDKVPLADTRRAIALMREQMGHKNPRIGVLGFSAGSHLATVASVQKASDKAGQPDFSLLIYGVTRMTAENRKWLEDNLYYRKMTAAEISANSLLDHVDNTTPPAFLVHAADDEVCSLEESTELC